MSNNTKSKNIVCVINAAAYSRTYFETLAPHLKNLGYGVHYVLDSHLTDCVYAEGEELEDASYFTDYLRARGICVSTDCIKQQSWSSLYSDFDRWLTFDIDAPDENEETYKYLEIPLKIDVFFNEIFERVRPVAVLYEPVSNSFAFGAYRTCQKYGIPFLSLSPSRISGRIELSTTGALSDHISIESIKNEHKIHGIPPEVLKITEDYLEFIDQKVPDYMKTNGLDQLSLINKYLSFEKLKYFWKIVVYSKTRRDDWRYAYQHGDPIRLSVAYAKRALWRKLRVKTVRKLFEKEVGNTDFLLYPLHFHPEASTSVLAADYVDELSVIKAVAFRLPLGMKLCVKEHPSAVALQPTWFYKQLSRLPNVKLISPELNTKELIRKSRGVVTLTSTAGFEAAALNKPVLAFGNVFYKYFENVKTLSGYQDLDEKISWLLNYKPLARIEIINAIAAYVAFGVEGYFDFKLASKSQDALKNVAKLVDKKLAELD